MNHNKRHALLVLLPGLLAGIVSCGGNQPASSEAPASIDASATTLAEAFGKLQTIHNYTVETVMTDSDGATTYRDYYTESYTFCDYEGDEEGFAIRDGQVFRLNRYQSNIISSDVYEGVNDLWGSELFVTPAISASSVEKISGNSGRVTNKLARLQYLSFLKFSDNLITDVTGLDVSFDGSSIEGLTVGMELSGVQIVSTFRNIGSTSYEDVASYVKDHGPATILPDLKAAASDFATNNFTRTVYDAITVGDRTEVYGAEYYLPEYFYGYFNEASGVSIQSAGYLSLHPKKYFNGDSKYGEFDGAYYFTLNSSLTEINSFLSQGPAFVTNVYDMPSIMNYPSKMVMWDHNLQFFELDQEFEVAHDGVAYTTYDEYLIGDFFLNCQVNYLLPEYATLYLKQLTLSFDPGATNDPSDDLVTFYLRFKMDGETYECEYFYKNFGASDLAPVDEFKACFVNA